MLLPDLQLYTFVEYCCVGFPQTRNHSDWLVRFLENMEKDEKLAEYLKAREPALFGA
jgi:hypothetical protein